MKKLTLKQLQERIDELERQVRELQARPVYVPVFPPSDTYKPLPQPYQPYTVPNSPYIGDLPLNPNIITCGNTTTVTGIQLFKSQEGQNQ